MRSPWLWTLVASIVLLGMLHGLIPAMVIGLALQSAFFLFLPHYHQVGAVIPRVAMLFMSAGMATGTVQPPSGTPGRSPAGQASAPS